MTHSASAQWVRSHGFFFRKKEEARHLNRPPSHLCMEGGALYIPRDFMPQFYRVYASDCMRAMHGVVVPNYYVTQRDPSRPFALHFDIDGKELSSCDPCEVTARYESYLSTLYRVVHGYVHEHAPSINGALPMYICSRPPAPIKTSNTEAPPRTSYGYHVTFKTLCVTKHVARIICASVWEELEKEHGPRDSCSPWHDVIDNCVFKGNGIRIIGSRKIQQCSQCKPKNVNQMCGECHGKLRYDSGKQYGYVGRMQYDDDDTLHIIKPTAMTYREMVDIVTATDTPMDKQQCVYLFKSENEANGTISVYTYINSDSESAESTVPLKKIKHHVTSYIGETLVEEPLKKRKRDQQSTTSTQHISTYPTIDDPEALSSLSLYISSVFTESPTLKRLVRLSSEVIIGDTDSHYCENVGRTHHSNRVYFVITVSSIRQKCHCKCLNTGCANYTSRPRETYNDYAVLSRLFPEGRPKRLSIGGISVPSPPRQKMYPIFTNCSRRKGRPPSSNNNS